MCAGGFKCGYTFVGGVGYNRIHVLRPCNAKGGGRTQLALVGYQYAASALFGYYLLQLCCFKRAFEDSLFAFKF